MKAGSQNVALADVPDGALAAADIIDQNGQLLIPAEAALTEKMIAILERRQIERVDVVVPVQFSVEEKEQRITEIQEKLDRQFSGATASTSAMQLKDILFKHHCREL